MVVDGDAREAEFGHPFAVGAHGTDVAPELRLRIGSLRFAWLCLPRPSAPCDSSAEVWAAQPSGSAGAMTMPSTMKDSVLDLVTSTERRDDLESAVVRVTAKGEIDAVSDENLSIRLSELIDHGARVIVLDAGAVSFMDSSGLRVIIGAGQSAPGTRRAVVRRGHERRGAAGAGDHRPARSPLL